MRGKVTEVEDENGYKRITPAYAGKSDIVHAISKCDIGSPPPMRGKVRSAFSSFFGVRITPAYAGKRR